MGRLFLLMAWGAGLFLATRFFGAWEARQENPNQQVVSEHRQGSVEVRLAGNAQGHFVANGQINGSAVTFMVDTGASEVAIPGHLAERLALKRGPSVVVSTANGRTQGYRTQLDTLALGDIRLTNVRALVVPGLDGDQALLGMSALKRLEFTQRGGSLLLRQTTQ